MNESPLPDGRATPELVRGILAQAAKAKSCGKAPARVTVNRSGAEWSGVLTGYIDRPCMVLTKDDGQRVPIVLDGSTVTIEEVLS